VQVVIALVVTPEGLPLAYEVLPGNTADNTTLRDCSGAARTRGAESTNRREHKNLSQQGSAVPRR
jgi:hypothetical protein